MRTQRKKRVTEEEVQKPNYGRDAATAENNQLYSAEVGIQTVFFVFRL